MTPRIYEVIIMDVEPYRQSFVNEFFSKLKLDRRVSFANQFKLRQPDETGVWNGLETESSIH